MPDIQTTRGCGRDLPRSADATSMKYPQGITGRTAGAAVQFWASVPSFPGTVVPSDRRFGNLDQAPRIVLERSPCARRPVRSHGAQKGEDMPQKAFTAFSALLLLAGLALPAADTMAQGARQLVGSWDTPKSASYGENARGLLIFTADGHYQLSIQRATLPKIASNNRTKGTPQEDHAVVEGSINHFGRYTVTTKRRPSHSISRAARSRTGSERRRSGRTRSRAMCWFTRSP